MHSRSVKSALVLLAVTLAPRLSYRDGTPRMPGRRSNRKSAACPNCPGRLRKRIDGKYHCSKCLLTVDRLPPRRKR